MGPRLLCPRRRSPAGSAGGKASVPILTPNPDPQLHILGGWGLLVQGPSFPGRRKQPLRTSRPHWVSPVKPGLLRLSWVSPPLSSTGLGPASGALEVTVMQQQCHVFSSRGPQTNTLTCTHASASRFQTRLRVRNTRSGFATFAFFLKSGDETT